MRILHAAILAALASSTGAAVIAQETDVVGRGALQWKEIVPGVSFAPAYGDWEQGAHGKYVRIDHGAQIPMHTHSGGYRAVMISGRMANLYDGGQRAELGVGDHFHMAARRPHSHECLSAEPCFFYTHSDALWDIEVTQAP